MFTYANNCVVCAAVCAPCRTVTDVTVQPLGIIIAAISVASSGMQQILCGTLQRQHSLQSHQLLANTAPVQGVMLLLVGPLVDKALTGQWVGRYTVTTPGLACLLLSCLISVGVNISQFMCLGRFSAVTFQVSPHALQPAAAGERQQQQASTRDAARNSTGGWGGGAASGIRRQQQRHSSVASSRVKKHSEGKEQRLQQATKVLAQAVSYHSI